MCISFSVIMTPAFYFIGSNRQLCALQSTMSSMLHSLRIIKPISIAKRRFQPHRAVLSLNAHGKVGVLHFSICNSYFMHKENNKTARAVVCQQQRRKNNKRNEIGKLQIGSIYGNFLRIFLRGVNRVLLVSRDERQTIRKRNTIWSDRTELRTLRLNRCIQFASTIFSAHTRSGE